MKQAAAEQLLVAVRRVLAGGIYVSERVGASMIERFAVSGSVQSADPIERLSNRELQVLNLIGRGKTTREIAENLNRQRQDRRIAPAADQEEAQSAHGAAARAIRRELVLGPSLTGRLRPLGPRRRSRPEPVEAGGSRQTKPQAAFGT